jgi:hypothetical protein
VGIENLFLGMSCASAKLPVGSLIENELARDEVVQVLLYDEEWHDDEEEEEEEENRSTKLMQWFGSTMGVMKPP